MTEANRELVELIVAKLSDDEALLERFLDAPGAVIAELTDTPLDQATLDAIGNRLQKLYSAGDATELSDSELDKVAGGAHFARRFRSFKPVIGRMSGGTFTISSVF
jgi:hypothetical protein